MRASWLSAGVRFPRPLRRVHTSARAQAPEHARLHFALTHARRAPTRSHARVCWVPISHSDVVRSEGGTSADEEGASGSGAGLREAQRELASARARIGELESAVTALQVRRCCSVV